MVTINISAPKAPFLEKIRQFLGNKCILEGFSSKNGGRFPEIGELQPSTVVIVMQFFSKCDCFLLIHLEIFDPSY